jgi:UDP-N-acetylmuramyl pentapeptide phosphotransferase/UDP-N-acetylglucosamine-1-phosphate transferase
MNIFIKYFLVLFSSVAVTYFLTPLVRKIGMSLGLVAEPGGRRMHKKPTPLTGGIAVFAGMHLASLCIFCGSSWGGLDGHLNFHWWLLLLMLSSVLLLIGLLDDKLELRPAIKLFGQAAVAVAAYFCGVHLGTLAGIHLSPFFDLILTVLWFLIFINAFNLIDGMDGLAAGLGAIAATGMAAIFIVRGFPTNTLVMLALAGSCLAFLRYNFSPASIFLGDSGSMFIGFVLAFVALITNSKSTTLAAIGIPMLAIGVPVLDTLLAVWRRSIRARLKNVSGDSGKITKGDREHLHHRLEQRGLTQRKVVVGLYALNMAFVLVGISLTVFESYALGIMLVSFVAGTYVIVRHLAYVEFRDSRELLETGMSRPVSRVVAVLLYIPLDIVLMMSLSLLAVYITHSQLQLPWNKIKHMWLQYLPLYMGIPFLVLCVGRTYRTVWGRARITEYVRLAAEIFTGVLLAFGVYSFQDRGDLRLHLATIVVYLILLIPSVIILRSMWRILNDMVYWLKPGVDRNGIPAKRIIVIGAGRQCILFLRSCLSGKRFGGELVKVVGILDDDSNLHRRYVHGVKVFGGLDTLRDIIHKEKIDQVIITADLDSAKRAELFAAAKAANVSVVRFRTVIDNISY